MSGAFSFNLAASDLSALTVPSGVRLHAVLRPPELPAATSGFLLQPLPGSAFASWRLLVGVVCEPLTPAALNGGRGFSEASEESC